MMEYVWKLFRPFKSRKNRVALVTLIMGITAEYGLHLDEKVVYGIIGVGVTLILAIAHEDHGHKMGLPPLNGGNDKTPPPTG